MLVRDGLTDNWDCKTAVIMIKRSSTVVSVPSYGSAQTHLNAWRTWTDVIGFFVEVRMRLFSSCVLFSYSIDADSHLRAAWSIHSALPLPFSLRPPQPSIFTVSLFTSVHSSIPLCSRWRSEVTDVASLDPPECNPDPCLAHSCMSTHCCITQLCVCVCVSRSVCERQAETECQEVHVGV